MRILAIDTATEACSAALLDGERAIWREMEVGRGHAERILTLVDQVLAESGLALRQLDAIAFGRGPGSFTGVRLAAGVTQGLAFGAGLPVVPISDLQAIAQQLMPSTRESEPRQVLVCNDARMQEVYWGCFRSNEHRLAEPVGPERVSPPDQVRLPQGWSGLGAGRGFTAYADLRSRLGPHLSAIHADLLPRAREIALLARAEVAAGRLLSPEEALPVYLRDDVARPPSSN